MLFSLFLFLSGLLNYLPIYDLFTYLSRPLADQNLKGPTGGVWHGMLYNAYIFLLCLLILFTGYPDSFSTGKVSGCDRLSQPLSVTILH